MPFPRIYRTVFLIGALLFCTPGCLVTQVKWFEPDYFVPKSGRHSKRVTDPAESLYSIALDHEKKCLSSCVDLFLDVAIATSDIDGPSCDKCGHLSLHKSALFKLIVTGQRFNRFDPEKGLMIYRDGHADWIPICYKGFVWKPKDFHHIAPVGQYRTKAFRRSHRCPGLGVPLVVTRCGKEGESFLSQKSIFPATLRIVPGNRSQGFPKDGLATASCQLQMYDPLRVDRAMTVDGPQPIARDLSASLAYRLRNERRTYFSDFIDPDSARGEGHLRMVEPYQSGKTPVVLVHGLLSDPYTWVEMFNELRAYPGYVDQFQTWVFEYPTGRPFLSSAADLREQLDSARGQFDPMHMDPRASNMVLVGHSMGGLISKLQVTSSENHLWSAIAKRPFDQVNMSDQTRGLLSRAFFFRPSPHVSRVIFMATPHKGSAYAGRLIGRLGSALVSPPPERRQLHRQMIESNPGVFTEEVSRRIPTSIDLLNPRSPLLSAISQLPASDQACMHSVIGDKCLNLCLSRSDGVVPVESAREQRAVTERYVRTTHGKVNEHPESIDEVLRILGQHLKSSPDSYVRHASLPRR